MRSLYSGIPVVTHFKNLTRKEVPHKRYCTTFIEYVDLLTELATKRNIIITSCIKPQHGKEGVIEWIEK